MACTTAFAEIETALIETDASAGLTEEAIERIVSNVRASLSREAESSDRLLRDFACTLVGAVLAEDHAWFFQCGDGAIIASNNGSLGVVFWPAQGEYANMTHFVTDAEWRENLQITHARCCFSELALLSDGLQRLALSFDTKTAFRPFFDPMFARLRSCADAVYGTIGEQLGQFLDSASVNERTDDDKTLVLATR